jgi:hypothetical protein
LRKKTQTSDGAYESRKGRICRRRSTAILIVIVSRLPMKMITYCLVRLRRLVNVCGMW